MYFPKPLSLLAIITISLAAPLPDTASADGNTHQTPSTDIRQCVVNVQATIVSLINNFVQSTSPASNFQSATNQLANIAQATSISCASCPPKPPVHNPQDAIMILTQAQNSLNQFNLDLVTGGDKQASFCEAWGDLGSVRGLATGGGGGGGKM